MSDYLQSKAAEEESNEIEMHRNPLNTTFRKQNGDIVLVATNHSFVDLENFR